MSLPLDGGSCAKQYQRIAAKKPLIQCITNFVSMDLTANCLNAIGASPAMVHSVDEVEEFLAVADALVINVGTLSREWVESMQLAAKVASKLGKPWVLDPVGAGATEFRTQAILELLSHKPAILRGNASEILALAGATGVCKGVDSTAETWDALEAGKQLAKRYGNVVAISGKEDLVTDGERVIGVDNGVTMLAKITATGCSLTAIMAAFLAVAADGSSDSIMLAAAYAFSVFGICAENVEYEGPGSLRVRMIDKLYNMVDDGIDIEQRSFIALLDKGHSACSSTLQQP